MAEDSDLKQQTASWYCAATHQISGRNLESLKSYSGDVVHQTCPSISWKTSNFRGILSMAEHCQNNERSGPYYYASPYQISGRYPKYLKNFGSNVLPHAWFKLMENFKVRWNAPKIAEHGHFNIIQREPWTNRLTKRNETKKYPSVPIHFHSIKCIWKCLLENGGHLSRPRCVKKDQLNQHRAWDINKWLNYLRIMGCNCLSRFN